ncbi:uncharacterized protein SPPG_01701 [Spizellomyces punctatus DAOM BR117]|uniref:Uncharacterized protein n=1 Tax=Spizellomyces punctatus (strain DAOM BR117) TaxID=645134 RepID=A0A0L0HP97_SPIPD|nr:uncharacterized protein SPPG_01701 [Spizellomyces punctatus DAOM BR117]KND02614.1 hypothetical protein SPPG_01701 [Spizellomyces punctatus DAOM BR117]|eukprot:XP_016610653.1 hypothetical protein SPPG_01701 [Spizellomyces punctatus DAOM BR117]
MAENPSAVRGTLPEWQINTDLRPPSRFSSPKRSAPNVNFMRQRKDHKHNLQTIRDPAELRALLARTEDTLKDSALISGLSDKGEKLRLTAEAIKARLKEIDATMERGANNQLSNPQRSPQGQDADAEDEENDVELTNMENQMRRMSIPSDTGDREIHELEEKMGELHVRNAAEGSPARNGTQGRHHQSPSKAHAKSPGANSKVRALPLEEVVQLEDERQKQIERARIQEAKERLAKSSAVRFSTKPMHTDEDDEESEDDDFDFI